MTEKASRRDLFRLLGRTVARAAGEAVPLPPGEAPPPAPRPLPPEAILDAPVEGGRLVVDLAVHPIPPGRFRRFRGAGAPEVVLVARVNDEHLAGVSGECPRCGDGLRYDPRGETVICLRDGAVFRLDGMLLEGPPGLRLRTYPCLRAGQRVEVDLLHA